MRIFNGLCLPSVMYECETWMINARARKSLNVFEMKWLRAIFKLREIDPITNERIREMGRWKRSVVDRAEEGMLKCFGHMCRMNEIEWWVRYLDSSWMGLGGGEAKVEM